MSVMSAACLGGFTIDPYQRHEEQSSGISQQSDQVVPAPTSSFPTEADLHRRKTLDELLELRRLESDWDGDGAIAPIPEIVDSAIALIDQTRGSMPNRIVPVNDGRITLEWERDGYFESLRVESPYNACQMVIQPDGTTTFSHMTWPR